MPRIPLALIAELPRLTIAEGRGELRVHRGAVEILRPRAGSANRWRPRSAAGTCSGLSSGDLGSAGRPTPIQHGTNRPNHHSIEIRRSERVCHDQVAQSWFTPRFTPGTLQEKMG